ncbi:hypothetical protein Sgly_1722 [Syntrophobotulus glycolicus DSM 8271]|uniref:Uncharacterized protein n=1 Tax=Syntrophobotulus glycolicus (strain DSM 8271 / FlGlyR) TaxID=645991 RepID=F0SYY2_SYNGF|nr:hypothetical protein [Syntrophobotulus glycolicus]ADY56019.1 hypothetical protein Sgly_1722 [Syntrophobotulus glycolicus DSM 8271]
MNLKRMAIFAALVIGLSSIGYFCLTGGFFAKDSVTENNPDEMKKVIAEVSDKNKMEDITIFESEEISQGLVSREIPIR